MRGATNLSAVTNVGSVTAVRGGRATYTPPVDRRPQVAVVLVYGEGVAGAVSIPLLGRAELPVQTEPNASVVLEAGGERFGPVTADAQGRASIPIRLPPGIRSGTIVARDRVGNETRRPADLGVLRETLHEAAAVWRDGLPGFGVNWFNEMALRMARVPTSGTSCGADCGAQVAVAGILVEVAVQLDRAHAGGVELPGQSLGAVLGAGEDQRASGGGGQVDQHG